MGKKQKKKETPQPAVAPQKTNSYRADYFLFVLIACLMITGLLVLSNIRNRIYKTPVTLWADNVKKSPDKRRTHENYGQALSTYGFYPEALEQFKTVLAMKDDGSVPMRDVYRELGVVYFRMGLIDDSIASWQTGLKHAPYDPSLLNNLSVAFLRQQRFNEAEQAIRQALAGQPNLPQALNSLGEILMVKQQYQEALKYFLEAIRVSPERVSQYWNAALAFEKTGRLDMAWEYANRYVQIETDPRQRQKGAMYLERIRSFAGSSKK